MNALIGLVITLAVVAWLADTLIEAIKADPQPWIAAGIIVALGPVTLVVRRIVHGLRARKTAQAPELDWEPVVTPRKPYVPKPRPATSRTAGLLAELSGEEAVITYRDIQGTETRRRIAIWYLTGLRERAGDTIEGIEAWCHLRNEPRTFYFCRIASLIGEDGITPAASPEDWLRKQAGSQVNPPPPFIAEPPAPAEIVLFDGLSFEAVLRYRDSAGEVLDRRVTVQELRGYASGRQTRVTGHDHLSKRRRTFPLDSVLAVADAETGEFAESVPRWLRAQALASVKAGRGRKPPKSTVVHQATVAPAATASSINVSD
jgi:predicted DNA-binding transcriptional regulator YafY